MVSDSLSLVSSWIVLIKSGKVHFHTASGSAFSGCNLGVQLIIVSLAVLNSYSVCIAVGLDLFVF